MAKPGPLAWLPVDLETFFTAAFDVRAAVAILGKPVSPAGRPEGTVKLDPSPAHRNLKGAELWMLSGDLHRITLAFQPTVRIDLAAVTRRLGPSRVRTVGFPHFEDLASPLPMRLTYTIKRSAYTGSLSLEYSSASRRPPHPEVYSVTLERSRTRAQPPR